MMRAKYFQITASGKSAPIPLDRYVNGYAIGVTMNNAGAVYTLQYSLLDPFANYSVSYATSGRWFDCDDPLLVNASTNRSTNFAFAPAAVRVNASAKVSAGNPITLSIIPMGAM